MTDIVGRLRYTADAGVPDFSNSELLDEAAGEIERLRADAASIKAVVDEQADDEGLWFIPTTITEDYLQRALRRLHAVIEGESPEQCAREALGGEA